MPVSVKGQVLAAIAIHLVYIHSFLSFKGIHLWSQPNEFYNIVTQVLVFHFLNDL